MSLAHPAPIDGSAAGCSGCESWCLRGPACEVRWVQSWVHVCRVLALFTLNGPRKPLEGKVK